MKKRKNRIIAVLPILLLLSGPVCPALAFEESSFITFFNPLEWLSKLFPKKENSLKLKINVPPPPPPSILYQGKENLRNQSSAHIEEKSLPQPRQPQPPLKEPQPKPSPWHWY